MHCSFVQNAHPTQFSISPFSSQGCDTVARLVVRATKITPDIDTRYTRVRVACGQLSTHQSPGLTSNDCLWSEVLPSLQRRHGRLHLFRRRSCSRLSVLDERMTESIIRGNPPGRIKLQTLLQQVDEMMHLLQFRRRHGPCVGCESRPQISARRRFVEVQLLHRGVACDLVTFLRNKDILWITADEVLVRKC